MANATNVDAVLICGIDARRIDEKAVDEALRLLDIHPSSKTKLPGKVELLVEHFREMPAEALATCDAPPEGCGADSARSLPRCPFCGKGDAPAAEAAAEEPDGPADAPEEDRDEPGPGDVEVDVEVGEDEPEVPPVLATPPPPAPTVAEHPTTGQPLVDKKAAQAARRAAAKEAKAAKKAPPAPRQSAAGESVTAIVERGPDKAVAASTEQLDRDVAEVRRLSRGMGAGVWLLAQKIAEISESQRWKLRLDDAGKVKYRTFEEFANAELGIGRAYALDLQKIAVRFTQEVFESVGYSKLRLVLQAPADQQEEVLNAIKEQNGAIPKRKVAEDVAERRRKAGMKDSRGQKPKKPAEKGKVTVAAILGKHTIRAYKKPEKRLAEGETPPRAKRLADRPYASFKLANDTTLWIEAATDGGGEIVFKLDVRRDEE